MAWFLSAKASDMKMSGAAIGNRHPRPELALYQHKE